VFLSDFFVVFFGICVSQMGERSERTAVRRKETFTATQPALERSRDRLRVFFNGVGASMHLATIIPRKIYAVF
jgi:hypothetical protein